MTATATATATATSPRRAPGAAGARRPQLRVVAPPRHTVRYLVATVLAGGLGVFGVVGLHALAAEQSFEVRNLETEVRELSLRYDELTAEIARLESPARVRDVAMVQLGMVPAERPGFLVADSARPASGDFAVARGTLGVAAAVADPVKHALAAGR